MAQNHPILGHFCLILGRFGPILVKILWFLVLISLP